MTIHDQVRVAGVSESCRYNDHSECRAPACVCDCHKPAVVEPQVTIVSQGVEKACPKCGVKRPFIEVYCRIDGERLASLLCGVCGAGMNVEDLYCYNCGSPKGKVAEFAKDNGKPNITLEVPDYGQLVLKGLQEELDVQHANEVDGNKRVVEQPAGTQGSFKLVSGPNPNKVRGPVAQGPPSDRRISRLPIKPT